MSIKDQITSDMRDAMRAHEKEKLSALRMLLSSIKQKEVDEQIVADDAVIQQIIAKLIKQRNDSVEQYTKGGREDLAAKEAAEIEFFKVYLPVQLSDSELEAVIDEVLAGAGLGGMAAMGKAMGLVKPKVAGKADMGRVSALIKAKLTQ
ncbi:GatB/YqeY domain-containing protein [uncultured Parasutterella sp.]|uniref:GatB/YqeY domain-containing protein n=1 Tax=uncultured Parasutterella sp. TaxID=1263098 RepID=UPI0034A1AB89